MTHIIQHYIQRAILCCCLNNEHNVVYTNTTTNLFQHLHFVRNPLFTTEHPNCLCGNLVFYGVQTTFSGSQSGPSESTQQARRTLTGRLEKQLDLQHESITSIVCRDEVKRGGLNRAQPVPRWHHFLRMSHRVLPLLHCFWKRAVESQLNLQGPMKRQ